MRGIESSVAHLACEIYFNSGSGPIIFWIVVLLNKGVPVAIPCKMTEK
jgi:hypothetical protein